MQQQDRSVGRISVPSSLDTLYKKYTNISVQVKYLKWQDDFQCVFALFTAISTNQEPLLLDMCDGVSPILCLSSFYSCLWDDWFLESPIFYHHLINVLLLLLKTNWDKKWNSSVKLPKMLPCTKYWEKYKEND